MLGRAYFHYPFFRQALKNREAHSFRFVGSNDNFPISAGWEVDFQLELGCRQVGHNAENKSPGPLQGLAQYLLNRALLD